ncbi:MAG TPA: carboxypeptidase regulatory-like domain-containing protein, partial [bacterium]|nr:carboxypeptidase regulatory-like domain-containing protein [bacterium]
KYKTKNPGGTGKQIIKLYDRDISGVDFTLEAIPTYTISGKVTITDGDVTKVKIVCSSGAEVYPDVYGRYSITDLLAGTYTVSAEMDGFIVINPKTNLYSVKIGPDAANCDFTLIRYYTISGTVKISGGTGDLGSAVVYCDSQTTKPDPSTGYYEFSKLIPGSYNVYVKLNGYTATFPGSGEYKITLGPDATLKDFTLTATTLLSVSGKVSILGGPGKMSDVTINIATLSTIPDENGNYTISGVSPGTYDLTASLSNYSVTSPPSGKYRITFNKTNLTGYNFNLATFKISGNVKLIGTGNVTDVVIKCDDGTSTRTTSPDSTGHYEFTPLPSGQYKITASLADYSTIIPAGDGSYTITLGPDAKDKNFTLMTYSISGKAVFWQTSGDITTITITLKGSSTTKTTHPDSNGNYSFATVSTGDYELSADLPGYTVVAPKDGKYSLSVKGNITEKNFTITAFSISGKVSLYNSPNPVTSVTITLKGETGTINTAPDAKGNYQFSPLPAGTYTISASLNNHTVVSPLDGSYTVTIPQNATGKDFNIVAYSISGAVKIYDAAGPAGATVYCQGDAGTIQYTVDTTGKFQFYPLPAGNYKLWVEKSGYKTTYPAEEVYQIKLDSILTKNFALQKK